ncbi:hypothetical protein [Paenibacillus popilliae]|nr:hypothetical protein [Paenibacillus popilliae]
MKMKTQMISVKAGETCKIDMGVYGMNVEGPAIIVVIKEKGPNDTSLQTNEEINQHWKG